MIESFFGPMPPTDRQPMEDEEWECQCARCGSSCDYTRCECEDGYDGHDCGEDCCACLHPEENVVCEQCDGHGGWYRCLSSPEFCEANPIERRERVKRGQIEWYIAKVH